MDRIAAAVRPLDACKNRQFVDRDAFAIQLRSPGHGYSSVKSKSKRVIGIRDRLLPDEQLMAREFGANFLAEGLTCGRPVVTEFFHPLDPDFVEMVLICGRTVSGFQIECSADGGHQVFEALQRLSRRRHQPVDIGGGRLAIVFERLRFGIFDVR